MARKYNLQSPEARESRSKELQDTANCFNSFTPQEQLEIVNILLEVFSNRPGAVAAMEGIKETVLERIETQKSSKSIVV